MTPEKISISTTTDGQPPRPGCETSGAPAPINPATGQHQAYWVLSEEERQKGFVRPVRRSYRHVGRKPKYPLRDLTPEEKVRHRHMSYVKFEEYPAGQSSVVGRFWTQKELNPACGTVTTMGQSIAETYARDPQYYGSTFCCHCQAHFPVGIGGEFIWLEAGRDTDERVGT